MKNHKWIVTHSVSYEVEAPSADEALAKFEREGASKLPQTKQVKFCEDWWDEEKKDTLQKIISEALIKRVGSAKGYDEYAKFWKKYKKILNSVSGWKTKEMLGLGNYRDEPTSPDFTGNIPTVAYKRHPENSNDDVVSVKLMYFDPDFCSKTLKTQMEDRVFYVDIPKDDVLKILTLGGVPF